MQTDVRQTAGPATRKRDNLGCSANRLSTSLEIDSDDIRFYRKSANDGKVNAVSTPASDRGFLVGVSMNNGHQRNIMTGTRSTRLAFRTDSIYIRDFSEDYRADLQSDFDFILIELSREFLSRLGDELGGPAIGGLVCASEHHDEVLGHLARALIPCFHEGEHSRDLFIEHVGLAIGTHVARQYGNARVDSPRGSRRLAPSHERLAKEMLSARLENGFTISDVATACHLSRGYFIRAFSETTGRTPHQWVLEQRIARARELMQTTPARLSDIAVSCGFSDQSHFSRIFSKLVGKSPAAWRRHLITDDQHEQHVQPLINDEEGGG